LILALDDEATADSVVETTRHSTAATDARFVRVLDAVADAEGFYIISEWVEGQPLSEIVQSGPLTPIESAWVAREIAEALTTIHPLKIYHQRLDPTRILVTTSGDIRIAGLTTAAALNPRPGDDQLSREELEAQDVRDLGRLLYSYETGAWPGPEAVGLPQAPQTDGVYVPPRQLRPASNDSLDRVIDQILSPTPQGDRPPLTTAQQVLTALGQVLGATDSSGELAHRLLWSANSAATADSITVNPTGAAQAKPAVSASVTPATTAAAATTAQAAQTAATDSAAAATKTSATSPPAPTDRRRRWPSSLAKSPTGGARAHSQLSEHRPWAIGFVVLAALIVLTLLTVLVVGLSRRSTEPEPAPASEAVSAVEVWSIDQAWAFDPFGSSHENDEDLDLADDGDPATAWLTETYPGPTFTDAVGRPKAGVGWVADLGQVRELNTIQLLLANSPSPVTIYVAADPNREAPALTGLDGWMAVAEDNGLTDPDSRTRTINLTAMGRFVLVFFHGQLPPTSDGSYQTGIAEITVGR
jgi:putative peptidoglycan lipid II flippase